MLSARPASIPELRRLTQAEVDAVCAKHDRLWTSRPILKYTIDLETYFPCHVLGH